MTKTPASRPSKPPEPPILRESHGGLACRWMESVLIHGEGDRYGEPYQLLPWHREFLWRWYELDAERAGTTSPWWYEEALVGAERGAVKTEFFAGVALLEFAGPEQFRRTTPVIELAAASFEQTGELFRQAQIMAGGTKDAPVEAAPLHGLLGVFEKVIEYPDGRPGMIRRRAAKAGTSEGGKPTLLLADEIHEWTGNKERVYTVHAAGLSKTGGRACAMSTAGAGRGSIPASDTDPLLWRLYARGLAERGDASSRFLFDWVECDESLDWDDPDQLRMALRQMRCADVTWSVERRARDIESKRIPMHEGLRYYGNRFVAFAHDSWLAEIPGAWGECDHGAAAFPADGSSVVVGVDMALYGDSVGVVVAGRDSNGDVCWWDRCWSPDEGGSIDHLDVFNTIAGVIAQRWRIKTVTYDPRFFDVLARMLQDQGIATVAFPQSPERLVPADGLLWSLVVDRRLRHAGSPVINSHAQSAAWRETERGRYLSKGKALGHMDLIRAGSMATWELIGPEEPVVESGFIDLSEVLGS